MISYVNLNETSVIFTRLIITSEEFAMLSQKENYTNESFQHIYSYKCCPTRHGCSGATNCDNSYGDYHR